MTYKDKTLIIPLYKATVRPHVEYSTVYKHGDHIVRI